MKNCMVDFLIKASHDTNEIGFYSCCEYQIIDKGVKCKKYISEILIPDDASDEIIKSEFEKIAKIGSIALAKNERNPSDACPFFSIDWKTLKIKQIENFTAVRFNIKNPPNMAV